MIPYCFLQERLQIVTNAGELELGKLASHTLHLWCFHYFILHSPIYVLFAPANGKHVFHHIVLYVCSLVITDAVFLYNMEFLKSHAISLVHVVLTHRPIRTLYCVARYRVLGKEAIFSYRSFALDPTGHAHSILFQKSRFNQCRTSVLIQPLPRIHIIHLQRAPCRPFVWLRTSYSVRASPGLAGRLYRRIQ